jgi:hypothetical protein
VTQGLDWSVHLWTGSIVLAGVVGWLLSYLIVLPGQAALHVSPSIQTAAMPDRELLRR